MTNTTGRFGIELTVSNLELMDTARNENGEHYAVIYERLFTNWISKIKEIENVEFVSFDKDKFGYSKVTVIAPEKYELYIHSDDWVFEIGGSPMTSTQVESWLPSLQKIVFDTSGFCLAICFFNFKHLSECVLSHVLDAGIYI